MVVRGTKLNFEAGLLMRVPVMILVMMGLSACAGPTPDAASGPGFTDYNTYLDQRAAAAQQPVPAPQTGFSTDVIAGAIDAADGTVPMAQAPLNPMQPGVVIPDAALPAGARPRGDAPTNIQTENGEVAGYVAAGVSDEQDFAAVTARETIASDKARIEANRAQYVVVQPGQLPTRTGDTGPNIVDFALATTNPVGVAMYDRGGISLTNSDAACAKFASPDQAQQAFLAAGGPDNDRKNLDPDGDGFACGWDPTTFRTALQ